MSSKKPFGSQVPINMRMKLHHFSQWCLAAFGIVRTLSRGREFGMPFSNLGKLCHRASKLTPTYSDIYVL